MDFNDTPEEAAYRKQAQDWLAANAPKRASGDDPEGGGSLAEAKAWQARKAAAGYACIEGFSPFPIDGLAPAIGFSSNVTPRWCLIGGIIGTVGGFLMQVYCTLDFPLNIGGRPLIPPEAFALIAFELAVLGSVGGAVLAMLIANRLPKKVGRIQLCHVCTPRGGVACEWTITRLGEQSFYVISAAAAERHDLDILVKNLPADGSVTLRDVTIDRGVLVVAGPRARDLMQKITDADLSNAAFPWLSAREITVGVAPVRALRVNFVGELGWELHHSLAYQLHLWDRIMEAGKAFELRERSRFGRVDGRWRYLDGDTAMAPPPSGRNGPCPCGSGEKLKRCHG